MAEKIIEVKNLVLSFKNDHGILHAVRDVSFDLYKGETLCIVGESGSGKSVTSKAIMGILGASAIIEGGSILYRGEDLLKVSEDEFHKIRGHKIGMSFQDPLSSLNPIVRIGNQITEATLINNNKLKLMFDDLISDDLIKYKNVLAIGKINEDAEKNRLHVFVADTQKYLNKESDAIKEIKDKEEKAKAKTEHAAKVAKFKEEKKAMEVEVKQNIAKIRLETKDKAAPLKIKLDETTKEAKIKVAEYKKSILDKYAQTVADLKVKYADNKVELEKALEQAELDKVNNLKITKAEAKRRALEIMKEVGIPEPEKRYRQYPFEFSGGMRQRIVIAIALTETPEVLICDEPTTALDVTIQGQILELIKKIQVKRNLSVIFITHDLGVVANMADRVAVMYAGKIVEYGTSDEIFFDPKHPYTWALLSSIPDVDSKERLEAIPGTPPNMIYPPVGDAFAARNKYALKIDYEKQPPYFKVSDTHYAATWLLHPLAPKVEMPKIVKERIRIALANKKK